MTWPLSMEDKVIKYISDNCPSVTLHEILRELSERNTSLLVGAILSLSKDYTRHFLSEHDEYGLKAKLGQFVPSETFLAPPEPDPLMSVPFWLIKEKCGWGRWCEVVGGNAWMLNEYSVASNQTFDATKSQLSKLGII